MPRNLALFSMRARGRIAFEEKLSTHDATVPHRVTFDRLPPPVTIAAACFGGLPDRRAIARVSVPGVAIVLIDGRVGILKRVAALRPRAIVFPAMDLHGDDCAPLIERVLHELAEVAPAVLVRRGTKSLGISASIRAGAALYTWANDDDLAAALLSLSGESAERRGETLALAALVERLQPTDCVAALVVCIERSHRRLDAEALAQMLTLSSRTLRRRMHGAGWPPPAELIQWGRLVRASLIQWREESTLGALANAAGFRSPQAMARCARRLLGSSRLLRETLTPGLVGVALRRRVDALAKVRTTSVRR
jgi:AraC-like DNA-binding protein